MSTFLATILNKSGGFNNYLNNGEVASKFKGLDFETFKSYMVLLITTQNELNVELCGPTYALTLIGKNGKTVRYGNALISEANELLDSTPWKHWKDTSAPIDLANIPTELVDFLHFLPSVLIVMLRKLNPGSSMDAILNGNDLLDQVIEIAWRALNTPSYGKEYIEANCMEITSINAIIGGYCNLTPVFNPTIVGGSSILTYEDGTTTPKPEDLAESLDETTDIIAELVGMSLGLTIKTYLINFDATIEDLWNYYIVKNTLNSFRAANGYKEGTYIKIWGTEEDNIIAGRIAKENPGISKAELFALLDEAYLLILEQRG